MTGNARARPRCRRHRRCRTNCVNMYPRAQHHRPYSITSPPAADFALFSPFDRRPLRQTPSPLDHAPLAFAPGSILSTAAYTADHCVYIYYIYMYASIRHAEKRFRSRIRIHGPRRRRRRWWCSSIAGLYIKGSEFAVDYTTKKKKKKWPKR